MVKKSEVKDAIYDEKLYRVPADSVIVLPDRTRQEFNVEELRELATSIRDRRQDTPGICRHDDSGRPVLVAGERRLKACKLIDIEFTYRLESSVDPLVILEIEVEENVCRSDLTWLEKCNAMARLQEVKRQRYGDTEKGVKGGWTEQDTANFTKKSIGKVHEDIQLSKFAEKIPEVANAKNKADATKIIKRMTKDLERQMALEEAQKKAALDSGLADPDDLEMKLAYYANKIHHGKMEAILPKLKETYDVVIFDPPWGVDYDKNAKEVSSQQMYKDDKEFFEKNFPVWLKLLYEKMTADSHLYVFFGIVNYDYVYKQIELAGFKTNRIPIIWYKQGVHRTRNPDIWPGRSYEPIAYCRKGKKPLSRLGAPDIIITPGASPNLKQSHPSGKHPNVYLDLLQRSAAPGDRCLDPMAGSGMMGVAADALQTTHQLIWDEIEMEKNFYLLAINNAARGMYELIKESELGKERPDESK